MTVQALQISIKFLLQIDFFIIYYKNYSEF